jgi:hypothetical protein
MEVRVVVDRVGPDSFPAGASEVFAKGAGFSSHGTWKHREQ